MFLSKLFGIFKRKKDDSKEESAVNSPSGAVVPPAGTVGAAVGLSQPDQSTTPGSDQIAQAPQEPSFTPAPPSDPTSDSLQSSPPSDSSSGIDFGSTPVSEPTDDSGDTTDTPAAASETPAPEDSPATPSEDGSSDVAPVPSAPESGSLDSGSPDSTGSTDDNQNIAV